MPVIDLTNAVAAYRGSQSLKAVYKGSSLIWQAAPVVSGIENFYGGAVQAHHSAASSFAEYNQNNDYVIRTYTDMSGNSAFDGQTNMHNEHAYPMTKEVNPDSTLVPYGYSSGITLNSAASLRTMHMLYAWRDYQGPYQYDVLGHRVEDPASGPGTCALRLGEAGGNLVLFNKDAANKSWRFTEVTQGWNRLNGWNRLEMTFDETLCRVWINDTLFEKNTNYEDYLLSRTSWGGINRGMGGWSGDMLLVDKTHPDFDAALAAARAYMNDKYPSGSQPGY